MYLKVTRDHKAKLFTTEHRRKPEMPSSLLKSSAQTHPPSRGRSCDGSSLRSKSSVRSKSKKKRKKARINHPSQAFLALRSRKYIKVSPLPCSMSPVEGLILIPMYHEFPGPLAMPQQTDAFKEAM